MFWWVGLSAGLQKNYRTAGSQPRINPIQVAVRIICFLKKCYLARYSSSNNTCLIIMSILPLLV